MRMIKRIITGIITVLLMIGLCSCEMPENMPEIGKFIAALAGDAADRSDDTGTKTESSADAGMVLEPIIKKTWTLCAIEDANGYNDKIYDDANGRVLLAPEWVMMHIDPAYGVKTKSGQLVIGYMDRSGMAEYHTYQFSVNDDELSLFYLSPDYDSYANDPDYESWTEMEPHSADWPFVLPMQEESWSLTYDESSDLVLIERRKNGEDTPYVTWYLAGEAW